MTDLAITAWCLEPEVSEHVLPVVYAALVALGGIVGYDIGVLLIQDVKT